MIVQPGSAEAENLQRRIYVESGAPKQVEISFGPVPSNDQEEFVISDPDVKTGMLAMAQIAYEAPTGKDLDEMEMDEFSIKCRTEEGLIYMLVTSLTGEVHDNFKINYSLSNGSN